MVTGIFACLWVPPQSVARESRPKSRTTWVGKHWKEQPRFLTSKRKHLRPILSLCNIHNVSPFTSWYETTPRRFDVELMLSSIQLSTRQSRRPFSSQSTEADTVALPILPSRLALPAVYVLPRIESDAHSCRFSNVQQVLHGVDAEWRLQANDGGARTKQTWSPQ